MSEITLDNISKSYGSTVAVNSVSFSLEGGRVLGLLGANGAGKSTLVGVMSGLYLPDDGQVRIRGQIATARPDTMAERAAFVFGENSIAEPQMSAIQYLRFIARIRGMTNADARIRDVIALLELTTFAERPIGALSGGNRRKVEIARALLARPQVLVLDEPARELDIPTKRSLWKAIRATAAQGTAVIIASHESQEILAACDDVLVLREGRVAWRGAVTQLGATPRQLEETLMEHLTGQTAAR